MELNTKLSKIEIDVESGMVSLKFMKEVVNGNTIIFSEPHRVTMENSQNLDAIMVGVNNHLIDMGFPAAKANDITFAKDIRSNYKQLKGK